MIKRIFANAKIKPTLAPQKYHHLLVSGFVNNGNDVQCISALPVTSKSHDKKCWCPSSEEEEGVKFKYSFFYNWAPLKFLSQIVFSFFATLSYLLRNRDCRHAIVDVLNWPIALGSSIAAKMCGRNLCCIVTDLPEIIFDVSTLRMKFAYSIINKCCSCYILITDKMNECINIRHKPYIVIEGSVDKNIAQEVEPYFNDGKRHITYTGAILAQYGVQNLIEGFFGFKDDQYVLDIFGNGDLYEKMEEYQKTDSRIHYHGVVPNIDAVRAQMSSYLLINPRPTVEDFTKYSFPIKNMEYLATGVPTASTALAGMEQNYLDHLLIIEDFSKEGITEFLIKTMSKPERELRQIGAAGRLFVLEQKNNDKQAKKIEHFLTSL